MLVTRGVRIAVLGLGPKSVSTAAQMAPTQLKLFKLYRKTLLSSIANVPFFRISVNTAVFSLSLYLVLLLPAYRLGHRILACYNFMAAPITV